jgi:hypothetical protein
MVATSGFRVGLSVWRDFRLHVWPMANAGGLRLIRQNESCNYILSRDFIM